MKILVLGSTGGLGTAIERVCKARGMDFTGLSHQDIEITDSKAVLNVISYHKPDVVVNSVAMIGVNPCEADPVTAFNVNAIAASYVAKACEKNNAVFVQPSSHAVFDGTKDGYYTERDIPRPSSIYSCSKYTSEIFASNICSRHYVVRFPTMFGPRRNKTPGFVDKIIEKIRNGDEIKVADDKIDSMTYLLDAAERLIWILEQKVPYGVYHIANSGSVSYYVFVEKLIDMVGFGNRLIRAKDSDFPALGYKPLKTAMKSEKLPPMRGWEEALHSYVSEYLKRGVRENV